MSVSVNSSVSVVIFQTPIFTAKECEDTPDTGVAVGATRTWDEESFYKNNMTYTCPFGEGAILFIECSLVKTDL